MRVCGYELFFFGPVGPLESHWSLKQDYFLEVATPSRSNGDLRGRCNRK